MKRESKRRKAKTSLIDFIEYTFPNYQTNWHHRYLCDTLKDWIEGRCRRLMVFMPPRAGKSQIVSCHLPAFLFGQMPECRIISASYAADLARKMNRSVQRIMMDPRYRKVFPDSRLNDSRVVAGDGSYLRNSDEFEIVGSGGYYKCAGVGGGLTGRGFDFGIIDDPVKDRVEAESPTFRNRVWEWFTSVFYTRQQKDARILVTLTRWHEDDLAGRLLKQMDEGKGDDWRIIRFPMIAEAEPAVDDPRSEGEPLWPERFPLQECHKIKSTVGTRDWSSLYQNSPRIEGGGSIKREWFRYFDLDTNLVATYSKGEKAFRAPIPNALKFATMDCAFTTKNSSDYTVLGVWAYLPRGNIYDLLLLDRYRVKKEVPDLIPMMTAVQAKWGLTQTLVETNSGGKAVYQFAQKAGVRVREYTATKDKEVRVSLAQPIFERGSILFPENASWLSELEDEALAFPNAVHDDQVDMITMAVEAVEGGKIGRPAKAAVGVTGTPRLTNLGAPEVGAPKQENRHGRKRNRRASEEPKW